VISSDDFYLGSAYHVGTLATQASYSAQLNVTVPVSIDGDYYFIVRTDAGSMVYEHAWETNNDGYPTTRAWRSPADRRPSDAGRSGRGHVVAPALAAAGHSLNITYRVTNEGVLTTPVSYWTDSYYLSTDETLNTATAFAWEANHTMARLNPATPTTAAQSSACRTASAATIPVRVDRFGQRGV